MNSKCGTPTRKAQKKGKFHQNLRLSCGRDPLHCAGYLAGSGLSNVDSNGPVLVPFF
jgi:hypothetical protein